MDNLQFKALLAGLFFGLWPLFMNKSGLNGNVSSLVFSGSVALLVMPFAIRNMGDFSQAKWLMVICASLFGALGVMSFNGMLAKATPQNVSTLFVLMIVVQTAVPVLYKLIQSGGITPTQVTGFAFAGIAAVLLTKG